MRCEDRDREGGDWNGGCRIAETLPGLAPGEPGNHLGEGEGVRKLLLLYLASSILTFSTVPVLPRLSGHARSTML